MTRHSKKLPITALCLLGILHPASAMAEDKSDMLGTNSWAQMTLSEGMTQEGKNLLNEVLHTTDSSVAGTAFICVDRKLRVIAASNPQNMSKFIDIYNDSRRQKIRELSISTNGTELHSSKWLYKYKIGFMKSNDHKASAIIYNAATSGKSVNLSGSGVSNMSVTLPPTNAAFAAFGRSCGIGSNKAG